MNRFFPYFACRIHFKVIVTEMSEWKFKPNLGRN